MTANGETAEGRPQEHADDGEEGRVSDYGIGPNAEHYVNPPKDLYAQLENVIAKGRGGVFGVTGVRVRVRPKCSENARTTLVRTPRVNRCTASQRPPGHDAPARTQTSAAPP